MAVSRASKSTITDFNKFNKTSAGFVSEAGPGLFFTVGNNSATYFTSSDGFTWTSRTHPTIGGSAQIPVPQNWQGKFRVTTGLREFISSDGINWEAAATPSFGYEFDPTQSVGFINGVFKKDGEIYRFTNAGSLPYWIHYTGYARKLSTSTGDGSTGDLTYFNDRWIIAQQTNSGQTVWTSIDDGVTWSRNNIQATTANSTGFRSIAAGPEIVVALWAGFDNGYGIFSSPDGLTWTKRVTINGDSRRVQYVNNLFFFGGASGALRTSPDGITWTARTSQLTGAVSGFAHNGSVYVAVDDGGRISSSPDGFTWTLRASGLVGQRAVGFF